MHSGVAEQALNGGAIQDGPVEQPPLASPLEVVEGGDDVEVGPVAAPASVGLAVEEAAAQVDQGVAPTLGGAAGSPSTSYPPSPASVRAAAANSSNVHRSPGASTTRPPPGGSTTVNSSFVMVKS